MLRSLHISNYILIDSLDVEWSGGLNIITGQTGAGKSILLGALSLLLGSKADSSMVSEGASTCVVEGEFELEGNPGLCSLLDENGVDWEQGPLTVRRVVNAQSGRSRCFVNDCPVQLPALQQMAGFLVDIHSQHQSLQISSKPFQLSVLDHYAGNSALLQDCSREWAALRESSRSLEQVRQKLAQLESEREYTQAQFSQLDSAHLQEDELEQLEAEQKQLSNAEDIKEALSQVQNLFSPQEGQSLDSALKEAGRLLDRVSGFVPSLAELSERVRSARIELSDIESTVSAADAAMNVSPERLQQVEERMGLIYELFRKHGCRTVGELIEKREAYAQQLFDSTSLEQQRQALEQSVEKSRKRVSELCAALHASRSKAAPALSAEIQGQLRFLELDGAVFNISLLPGTEGPDGADTPLFAFSSTGGAPADIAKCASGGEISRIMLCLKAVMARFTGMPTMIFDEIDTGVSGSAADKMGQMICSLGKDMQVLAITHLPQVAAKGDAHFVVEKVSGSSSMERVDGEGRVKEIARLLSGERISEEALANARILLEG